MKITNTGDLCNFMFEELESCKNIDCHSCPLYDTSSDIKVEGELVVPCDHEWEYLIDHYNGEFLKRCTKCSDNHTIVINEVFIRKVFEEV